VKGGGGGGQRGGCREKNRLREGGGSETQGKCCPFKNCVLLMGSRLRGRKKKEALHRERWKGKGGKGGGGLLIRGGTVEGKDGGLAWAGVLSLQWIGGENVCFFGDGDERGAGGRFLNSLVSSSLKRRSEEKWDR